MLDTIVFNENERKDELRCKGVLQKSDPALECFIREKRLHRFVQTKTGATQYSPSFWRRADLIPLSDMRSATLLSLLVVSFVCLTVAQVSYDDCCLSYKKQSRFVQKHAVSYRVQKVDGGCNIPAIIFVRKRGKVSCADPKDKWVSDLMNVIDIRRSKPKHLRKPTRG